MTSKKTERSEWPVPLRAQESRLGDVVREYVRDTDHPPPAMAADGSRATERRGREALRSTRTVSIAVAWAVVGACAAAAIVLHQRYPGPSAASAVPSANATSIESSPVRPSASVAQSAALPDPGPPSQTAGIAPTKTESIRLGDVPCPLAPGRSDLLGQAVVLLSPDGKATGRTQAGTTEIVIGEGSVSLDVLPRAPGEAFAVLAGPYQFTVVGTSFSVSHTRSRLELVVREGTVAVARGTRRLATVPAGGTWAVELNSVASSAAGQGAVGQMDVRGQARAPSTPEVPGSLAQRPDCGQLAAIHRNRDALRCYEEQADEPGLSGETAQYELARLWRDSLASPERALAAFRGQRSRFPKGALRTEADLSIIELLPRLGRHAEALTETEQFLAAHPKSERRGELYLMRGNIYREVQHDLNRAEREYARAAQSGGRVGDEGRFLRAGCLEALGRIEEATRAFRDYLGQSGGSHRDEAEKRLERLRP